MNDLPKIRVRGLRKSFGKKVVLDGIDLDIAAGTSFVVIGGSGSGKSVLLRCILGLMIPDEGSIEIDGENLLTASTSRQSELVAQIGMLFQNAALFDSMSVRDNIVFGLCAKGRVAGRSVSRPEAARQANAILEQVGLDPSVGSLAPSELSGGMQKRVGLARAIAGTPDIMFFDEPTTGLDPITGAVIDKLIVDCVKRLGCTALAITHDMASAQRIGDQAAMLYNGRLIWQGAAAGLLNSGNDMVDQFTHGRTEGPIKMELRC